MPIFIKISKGRKNAASLGILAAAVMASRCGLNTVYHCRTGVRYVVHVMRFVLYWMIALVASL